VIRHRASTAALRMLIAEAHSVARAGVKTA